MKATPAHGIEFDTTTTVRGGERECEVSVTAHIAASHPGQLYGPYEDSFPPEGGEAEVVSVIHGKSGKNLLPLLTNHEIDALETEAQERDAERG